MLIIVSTLVVAFAKEIASLVCSLGGIGDWDPERQGSEQTVAIWIGVVGFYVLDFSLNGLQAAMRVRTTLEGDLLLLLAVPDAHPIEQALVLDVVPSHQQNQVNAWLGRQSHLANICGYLCGYFDLGSVPALKWIGGGQFRRLGVIGCLVMALTVAVTCSTQQEEKRDSDRDAVTASGSALERVYRDIRDNIKNLPLEVRRVCYVQFFAWTSWFPFLFYGSVTSMPRFVRVGAHTRVPVRETGPRTSPNASTPRYRRETRSRRPTRQREPARSRSSSTRSCRSRRGLFCLT